jgi:hypothetical protein
MFVNLPSGNTSDHATPNRELISQLPQGYLYHGHYLCNRSNIHGHHHWIYPQKQSWCDIFIYTQSTSDCLRSYINRDSNLHRHQGGYSPELVLHKMGHTVVCGSTDLRARIACWIKLLCQHQELRGKIQQLGALIADVHIAQRQYIFPVSVRPFIFESLLQLRQRVLQSSMIVYTLVVVFYKAVPVCPNSI